MSGRAPPANGPDGGPAGTRFTELAVDNYFMYRRPTLCTLHIAVDFLKSLEIAVVWGGCGTGILCIYYIPVDDGMEQVLLYWDVLAGYNI